MPNWTRAYATLPFVAGDSVCFIRVSLPCHGSLPSAAGQAAALLSRLGEDAASAANLRLLLLLCAYTDCSVYSRIAFQARRWGEIPSKSRLRVVAYSITTALYLSRPKMSSRITSMLDRPRGRCCQAAGSPQGVTGARAATDGRQSAICSPKCHGWAGCQMTDRADVRAGLWRTIPAATGQCVCLSRAQR